MLTLAATGDLRLTLVDQLAGYRNSVGVYRIAEDGSFHDPRIVVTDTKGMALGSADPNEAVNSQVILEFLRGDRELAAD